MPTLALTLFLAGMLTILLPCILPLLPIVVGVSVTDRHPLRPLLIALGMVVSFVASTFLLQVVLGSFVEFADVVRVASFYVLLLFGIGFCVHRRPAQLAGAAVGALFFLDKGWLAVLIAAILGMIAMELGGRVATSLQTVGAEVQTSVSGKLGRNSLGSAFVIGATLGLVWAPCAGPALGLALTLVRDEPGIKAFFYLLCYALGSAVPLLIVAYGGQRAVGAVRSIGPWTGTIKSVAGVLLILMAIGLRYDYLTRFQTWIVQNTGYGEFGNRVENLLFPATRNPQPATDSPDSMKLPVLSRAPEFAGLGTWHNSPPLEMKELRGKVVLVDFWTYSCINCIRTLPYIQAYWQKYKDQPFVLVGIHTPEFTFEKSDKNVEMAIKEHGLTYPIAQDNDFGTWDAFANHYWPAKYLIDAEGRIRYEHFGEGGYDETDEAIASLLKEIGATASGSVIGSTKDSQLPQGPITPETYLHSRSWPAFQNASGDPDEDIHDYVLPADVSTNRFVLGGSWQLVEDERQVLRSTEGDIRIHAVAGEVNLVLGLEDNASPVQASVTVDGTPGKTFTVDRHDLYTLFKGDYGDHDVVLHLKGKGVGAYAFTFGG